MNAEHLSAASKTKPASRPKKATTKKRRRNSLYTLAAEFKKRHPLATAQEAWRHFTGLAGLSTVMLAYDATGDTLTYAPHAGRFNTTAVTRRSFEQQWYLLPG